MVFRRLLYLLTLAALLLGPVSMMSEHSAVAMPVSVVSQTHEMMTLDAGHCAEQERLPGNEQSAAVDCMIACACVPSFASPAPSPLAVAPTEHLPVLSEALSGLSPQAEPRPPQIA